jgi:hypothetical protein
MDVQLNTDLEVLHSSKNPAIKKEKATQINVQVDVKVDIYEHGQPAKKVTYDKPGIKADLKTIQQLKEESDQAYAHLKQIVTEMLKRQGMEFQEIKDLKIEDLEEIKVDEVTRKEAQAMIAEGGEYSPEKVSDRIVDFAKAISGGDKSKLSILKTAIDRGFEAAEEDFGGKLPDITKETHKLIMDKLDAWANEDQTPESQPDNKNKVESA